MPLPLAGKIGLAVGGSLLSSLLNKPSNARTLEQQRVERAQATGLERQNQIRSQLQRMIGELAGNPRPPQFRLGVGNEPFDFHSIAPMGEINLLMQLAGLGEPTGAVTAGSALQAQADEAGRRATGDTVQGLVELLLRGGFGGGGTGADTFQQGLKSQGLTLDDLLSLGLAV